MSGKFALIIGNTEYSDPGLAQLSAPGRDTEDFARVLEDREIGSFDDVNILLNQPEPVVREAIDDFFSLKKPDDLLVLYFSGHGVRDDLGILYLAVKNTNRSKLRSTAIKSDYIREAMDQSRSKRQLLILDCCNSGAFSQGTKTALGASIGTASAFEGGYGRIILTASDATQFAWEGDKIIGETDNSLFTHYLVTGLEGDADLDGDGRITVDELYDYTYEKVRLATPRQTPSKFSSKQQGEIVLRQSTPIENIKPLPLPAELLDELEDTRPYVREIAVQQLEKILKGRSIGMARSARVALERIAAEDDSRRVAHLAAQMLESIRQEEQKVEALQIAEAERLAGERAEAERKAKQEAERLALQKAEEERLSIEKAGAERKAQEEAERLAIQKADEERLAIEKAEAERKAREEAERLLAEQKAEEERIAAVRLEEARLAEEKRLAALKAQAERNARLRAWASVFWVTVGWVVSETIAWIISVVIGSSIGGLIVIAISGVVGGGISGLIGGGITAITLRNERILPHWKNVFWITLGWGIGSAVGGAVGGGVAAAINMVFYYESAISSALSSAIGGGISGIIGGAIGGGITAVSLLNENALPRFRNALWVTLGWIIGWAVSGIISWPIQSPIGGLVSGSIVGVIAGTVMFGQIRKAREQAGVAGQIQAGYEVSGTAATSQHPIIASAKKFLPSWSGRILLGGMLGIALSIIFVLVALVEGPYSYSSYFYSFPSELFLPVGLLIVAGGLAGLLTYPHFISVALLIIGFLIAGNSISSRVDSGFFFMGGAIGLPISALITRMGYWFIWMISKIFRLGSKR